MEIAIIAVCGLLGLLFGSFANVVIHRVPEGESVVTPRSACPSCGTEISPRDNVPVLSWLVLRGRCRHCGEAISGRYPLVELAGGLLFALVAWRFVAPWGDREPDLWALPAFLLFAWMLLCVTVIDARTRRIPNRLTYPLTPALAVLIVVAGLLNSQPGWALRGVIGGLVGFAALLVIALISPRGMGMGDVKLAAFLGIGLGYLSWGHIAVGLFGGFLLGGLFALPLLAVGRRKRKDMVPFGPFLAIASMVAVLFGRELIDGYLRISGLA